MEKRIDVYIKNLHLEHGAHQIRLVFEVPGERYIPVILFILYIPVCGFKKVKPRIIESIVREYLRKDNLGVSSRFSYIPEVDSENLEESIKFSLDPSDIAILSCQKEDVLQRYIDGYLKNSNHYNTVTTKLIDLVWDNYGPPVV